MTKPVHDVVKPINDVIYVKPIKFLLSVKPINISKDLKSFIALRVVNKASAIFIV
jgi:hypothetical protein